MKNKTKKILISIVVILLLASTILGVLYAFQDMFVNVLLLVIIVLDLMI